jgi:hypothetical protein
LVAWGLLLLSIAAGIWMAISMSIATGDHLHEARVETTVHAAPDSDAEVLGSLSPGDTLQCHSLVEEEPEWLNCSDIMERKYIRADAMEPVSD